MTTLHTTLEDQPLREFRAARKQVWIYGAVGLIGLISVALPLVLGVDTRPPTTPLIVGLLMAGWTAVARPVRVFGDRIEVKAAALAPLRVVEFDQIEALDLSKPKRPLLRSVGDAPGKGLRLPVHLLEPADREALLALLENRRPARP